MILPSAFVSISVSFCCESRNRSACVEPAPGLSAQRPHYDVLHFVFRQRFSAAQRGHPDVGWPDHGYYNKHHRCEVDYFLLTRLDLSSYVNYVFYVSASTIAGVSTVAANVSQLTLSAAPVGTVQVFVGFDVCRPTFENYCGSIHVIVCGIRLHCLVQHLMG